MIKCRIKEIRVKHFRAFTDARLVLDKVTFLVGRNAAGKSTLMDAMGFLSEAMSLGLDIALERRGGLEGIRQRQSGRGKKHDISIAVKFELTNTQAPASSSVVYGVRLGSSTSQKDSLVKEEILSGDVYPKLTRTAKDTLIIASTPEMSQNYGPSVSRRVLDFPPNAGISDSWLAVYDCLRSVSMHQPLPQSMKAEKKIKGEARLEYDGGNAGDVLKQLSASDRLWVEERLSAIVPGIKHVKATARAGRRVIVFEQESEGGKTAEFDATSMSDGTLRSLGILLALKQNPRPSIVMLDEIEDSLHPFAHEVLLNAIEEASDEFPVVVSTHNPEILSYPNASPDRIRVVQWNAGASQIYRLSENVRKNLKSPMTVGDLLRANGLWTEENPDTCGNDNEFFQPEPKK